MSATKFALTHKLVHIILMNDRAALVMPWRQLAQVTIVNHNLGINLLLTTTPIGLSNQIKILLYC